VYFAVVIDGGASKPPTLRVKQRREGWGTRPPPCARGTPNPTFGVDSADHGKYIDHIYFYNPPGKMPITRQVCQDTDGYWKYQVSKSGYNSTVIRLPNQ